MRADRRARHLPPERDGRGAVHLRQRDPVDCRLMRLLACAALAAVLPIQDADACECKRSLEDSARAATSVFVATLASMKCTAKPLSCIYEVKVESVWRGKPGATPTI